MKDKKSLGIAHQATLAQLKEKSQKSYVLMLSLFKGGLKVEIIE